jgi:argininosuccinate lyase
MTLWHGRFQSKLDPSAWDLNTSLPVDQRLALQDVRGSIAWAGGLADAGVITSEEAAQIQAGLRQILAEFEQGSFTFAESDEDIHTAVERRLGEIIGPVAGKLHTGRSRNDQVATDFRLWMLDTLPILDEAIRGLQTCLVDLASASTTVIMPGYTHLQRAQPVLLAHWFLSFFWPLQRDRERLAQLVGRVSSLPLGSGALAGTAYPLDREALAVNLGFQRVSPNSLDAVSDRDFAAEYLFITGMLGIHLSKLAEAMVLYTSAEFGYFTLSDAYSTGSSLMPQKKNPDLFELTRGKSGVLVGLLTGLLVTLKGLPSTYDKDLQEDKRPVFEATDTLLAILPAITGALGTMTVNKEKMLSAVDSAMLATDVADYLVRLGMPFRQAHGVVGKAVHLAEEKGLGLSQLTMDDWRALGPFDPDIYDMFDPARSIQYRAATGGTATSAVEKQLEQARSELSTLACPSHHYKPG